jgi:methyltransferase (TIGR00027 family)
MQATEVKLPVEHVSDTAYLVALYRAYESEREDANFKDPLARKLASPKVEQLEKTIPFREEGGWLMAVRTSLLDDHIRRALAEGVDTVVNLAAGLDTRPYRLELPNDLRWIEADLPGISEYKTKCLAQESPRCRLERVVLDLTNDAARLRFFTSAFGNAKKALVITEGILPYLPETTIRALATDLSSEPAVIRWVMDMTTPGFLNWFRGLLKTDAADSKVALKWAPEVGAAYFNVFGWQVTAFDSFFEGSEKLNRRPPAKMVMDEQAALSASDSGIVLLTKRV